MRKIVGRRFLVGVLNAHHEGIRADVSLDGGVGQARGRQGLSQIRGIDRLVEAHLDFGSAGKINSVFDAARHQGHDASSQQKPGNGEKLPAQSEKVEMSFRK